ncbi:MAG: DUF4065 domain-containing protein [Firmicutes bacterium]|nr:DUF4065 domain-containing protein [Bacillota bacterium]
MKTYKALQISSWIVKTVDVLGDYEERLSLLKLLKLLYYCEGCSLAEYGQSLFEEDIVAWEHGPVVVEVYNYYKDDSFNLTYREEDYKIVNQDEQAVQLIQSVLNVFGEYSAWGLRNKTHKETPWLKATDNGRCLKKVISREEMRKYFKENYVE